MKYTQNRRTLSASVFYFFIVTIYRVFLSIKLESGELRLNIYRAFSRISTRPGWWMVLRKINDVLAQHDSIYEEEVQESGNPSMTSTEKSKF